MCWKKPIGHDKIVKVSSCLKTSSKEDKLIKTLFIKKTEPDILLVQIYVDDIISGATSKSMCKEWSEIMWNEFEMSMMEEIKYFLGLQIHQIKNGTFTSQAKLCKELLKSFKIEKYEVKATPMLTSCNLDKQKCGKPIEERKYQGMIDSLFYFTISHPNIMFDICMRVWFQAFPKESHLSNVKTHHEIPFWNTTNGFIVPQGRG